MRYKWIYLALSLLFTFSFPLQTTLGQGTKETVNLPLLAANESKVMIQVSSFKERQDAETEANRLKGHNVKTLIRYESVKGKGMWYRVYAGQFDSHSQASKYARSLKTKGIISWFWIKSVNQPLTATSGTTAPQSGAGTGASREAKVDDQSVSQALPVQTTPALVAGAAKITPSPPSVSPALQGQAAQPSSPPADDAAVEMSAKNEASDEAEPEIEQEEDGQEETDAAPGWGVRFKSQTTLRAFERDTSKGADTMVLPLYQYLQLDFGDEEEGGWGMHLYGWGRYDLADSALFEDTADGELLHGYLEYSKPYSAFRLALGRKHIFAGVTNETVDGLQLSAGLGGIFSATVFGGVTAGSKESSTDPTYGGRLAIQPQPHYEFAISYQDTDLEGLPDQRAGVDLSFNWSNWLTFQGLSSYNIDSKGWREHNYSAAMRFKDVIIEPAYHLFNYRDYFGTGKEENSLFHFLKDTDEQVTIAGGDLQYQGDSPVRLALRYNHYAYDVRQEDAAYYAALFSIDLPEGSQIGGEAGRMDGETADNIYNLYRAYFYWANPFRMERSAFISGDVVMQEYETAVFGEDSATHISLSGGMHFFDDTLEVKLTGVYSKDPYFDENVEGVLTFQINY